MKNTKRILAMLLAVMIMAALCACGGNTGSETGKQTDQKTETQWEKDAATLEAAGYTVHLYTSRSTLSGYETGLKVDDGALAAYIDANKTGSHTVTVYYFTSADLASAKYENLKNNEGSVLKDIAIIINDQEGLIS